MDTKLAQQPISGHAMSGVVGTLEVSGCDQCESCMFALFSLCGEFLYRGLMDTNRICQQHTPLALLIFHQWRLILLEPLYHFFDQL